MYCIRELCGLQVTGWATQSIYFHKAAAGRPDRLLGYCILAVEWCEVWCLIS